MVHTTKSKPSTEGHCWINKLLTRHRLTQNECTRSNETDIEKHQILEDENNLMADSDINIHSSRNIVTTYGDNIVYHEYFDVYLFEVYQGEYTIGINFDIHNNHSNQIVSHNVHWMNLNTNKISGSASNKHC